MIDLYEILNSPKFSDWDIPSPIVADLLVEGIEEDLNRILKGELTLEDSLNNTVRIESDTILEILIGENLTDSESGKEDLEYKAEKFMEISDIVLRINEKYDISELSIKEMNDLFDNGKVKVLNSADAFWLLLAEDQKQENIVNELIAKGDEILKNEEKLKEISTEKLEDIATDLEDTDLIWILCSDESELTKYIKNSKMNKDLEAARRLISWIDSLNVLVSSELESRD